MARTARGTTQQADDHQPDQEGRQPPDGRRASAPADSPAPVATAVSTAMQQDGDQVLDDQDADHELAQPPA